jgi:hypothetical protein
MWICTKICCFGGDRRGEAPSKVFWLKVSSCSSCGTAERVGIDADDAFTNTVGIGFEVAGPEVVNHIPTITKYWDGTLENEGGTFSKGWDYGMDRNHIRW